MATGCQVHVSIESQYCSSHVTLTARQFVREHCWLVNFAGKYNSFLPIDMAQEHNIKDIKVCHISSAGPTNQLTSTL